MSTSDARIAANRRNAQKSTGPKSDEGKARSRANALKHGFAGSGVAWPQEIQAQLDAFVKAHVELQRPQDDHEAHLVARSATLAWQIARAERVEAAGAHARSSRGRAAELRRRGDAVKEQVNRLESVEDPALAVQALRLTAEGCDWILSALREMLDGLERDWWDPLQNHRLDALCKDPQPGMLKISRARALAMALSGHEPGRIWPNDIPGIPPFPADGDEEARRAWSSRIRCPRVEDRRRWVAELKSLLEARIKEVESLRAEHLADGDPGLEFADVIASFDQSKEGENLRRYLRSLARERRAVLREIQAWRSERFDRETLPAVEYVIPAAEPVVVAEQGAELPAATPPVRKVERPAAKPVRCSGDQVDAPPGMELAFRWLRSDEDERQAAREARTARLTAATPRR